MQVDLSDLCINEGEIPSMLRKSRDSPSRRASGARAATSNVRELSEGE